MYFMYFSLIEGVFSLPKLFYAFYFSISTQMSFFFPLKSSQLSSILYPFNVTLYLNYTFIIVYIIFYCASSLHMCPTLKCQYFERVYD